MLTTSEAFVDGSVMDIDMAMDMIQEKDKEMDMDMIETEIRKRKCKPNEYPEASPFLSIEQVMAMTGLSRSTIYRSVERGEFPNPRKLGSRKSAFVKSEISSWIKEIIG